MKASLFCAARYMGATPHDIWPLSGEYYSGDAAVRSMQTTFDQFRCADEFGFDWVMVAEHHYSGFSLTPNPMVMAGATPTCRSDAMAPELEAVDLEDLMPDRGDDERAHVSHRIRRAMEALKASWGTRPVFLEPDTRRAPKINTL
jgi:hypothetical protein